MPAWLFSALALARGLVGRAAGQLPGAIAGVGISGLLDGGDGAEEEKPKRRRRRRALTASDRADIGFIAGLLGPTAGKNFALIIATRT